MGWLDGRGEIRTGVGQPLLSPGISALPPLATGWPPLQGKPAHGSRQGRAGQGCPRRETPPLESKRCATRGTGWDGTTAAPLSLARASLLPSESPSVQGVLSSLLPTPGLGIRIVPPGGHAAWEWQEHHPALPESLALEGADSRHSPLPRHCPAWSWPPLREAWPPTARETQLGKGCPSHVGRALASRACPARLSRQSPPSSSSQPSCSG